MGSRLKLHEELCRVLGTNNVYYDPPASVKMKYPCIRYSKGAPDLKRANNRVYRNTECYEGVVIDTNPDSKIPSKLLENFQMCRIGKSYFAENLYHTPFTIYY